MADAALTCSKCNEPLTISAVSFSVSCSGCGQWHTVNRAGPTPVAIPFEDVAAEPTAAVGPITPDAPEVPQAKIDEVLAQLDMDWQRERNQYLVFGWTGDVTVPTIVAGLVIGLVPAVLAAVVYYRTRGTTLPDLLAVLALLGAGLGLGGYRVKQALTYQDAYQRYQRRRRASAKAPSQP